MQQGPNRPTVGEQIAHAAWVAEAVRLALKNWSARRIAKKLGLHHSTVSDALNQELGRVRPSAEEVNRRREQLGEALDEQIASWRMRSLKGNSDAAFALAKFYDRFAKLWGVDAVAKQAIDLNADIAMTTDARAQLLDRLARLTAGGGAPSSDPEPDGSGGSGTSPLLEDLGAAGPTRSE